MYLYMYLNILFDVQIPVALHIIMILSTLTFPVHYFELYVPLFFISQVTHVVRMIL